MICLPLKRPVLFMSSHVLFQSLFVAERAIAILPLTRKEHGFILAVWLAGWVNMWLVNGALFF